MQIVGGHIIYDPTQVASLQALAAGERVTDTFTYTVTDREGLTASASVQVIVQSPLDVNPVAGPGNIAITEDGEYDGSSLVQFASDPDALPGDPALHAIAVTVTTSVGALVTIAADGTFSYSVNDSPAILALLPGETLADTFAYQVADFQNGVGSGTITLTVTGTAAPPTAVDYFFAIDKTNILTVPEATGVLSQDSAHGAGNVLAVDTSQTDAVSSGGAAILMRIDGSFQYDPTQAFPALGAGRSYDDTFTYVIVDSYGQSSMAVVHIHVDGVEDPPIVPDYDILTGFWVPSDGVMDVDATRGLLSAPSSPNEGVTSLLTAYGTGNSALGATVIVNADGSFTYDPTSSALIQQLTAQGQDVIDTFSYGVIDPLLPEGASPLLRSASPQAAEEATVTIVVKAGHPPYGYDIVATNADNSYLSLGIGPSINNAGHVAFEGVNPDGKDSIWIWNAAPPDPDSNLSSSRTAAHSLLAPGYLSLAPVYNSLLPFERFGPLVQINDADLVLAQRSLGAGGLAGALPGGIPVVAPVPLALTYSEVYFGSAAWNDGPTRPVPYQVAVGDGGLSSAGFQWGNPAFLDMALASLEGVIGLTGITQAAAALPNLTNLMLLPRVWVADPVWASLFLSPADQNWTPVFWKYNSEGASTAIEKTALFELSLSVGKNAATLRKLDVNDFATIYPYLSLSNPSGAVPDSFTDYYAFDPGYMAIATQGSLKNALQSFLVTANNDAPRLLGARRTVLSPSRR